MFILDLILLPFRLVWGFIGLVFGLVGFVLATIIGLCLIVAGIVCVVSLVGAVFGFPLILLGTLFIGRSLVRR